MRDLYDAYAERLFDYASSLTGDRRAAADVVHDAFVDACRRAPRMRTGRAGLGAWLYGAVRRRCLRQDVTGTPTFPDASPSAAPLLTALADLDPADQELIVLAERHGLTPADAAAATGASLRRVRTRLDHARAHLTPPPTPAPTTPSTTAPPGDASPATASTAPPTASAAPPGVPATASAAPSTASGALPGDPTAPPGVPAAPSAATPPATAPAAAPSGASGALPGDPTAPPGVPATAPDTPPAAASPGDAPAPARAGDPGARAGGSGGRVDDPVAAAGDAPAGTVTLPGDAGDGALLDDEDSVAVLAAREPRPVSGAAGLAAPMPPVLPASLRHRFMHTATDPELAGYRADIAARGGALTPDGMPTQPDVTSPFTRRWLFTGGGMLGALVTAVVAVLLMGPGIAGTTTYWPPGRLKETPRTTVGPSGGTTGRPTPQPTGRAPKLRAGAPPLSPGASGTPKDTPGQGPGTPGGGPSATPGPRDGTLRVDQSKVELYGTKTGRITLHATGGPVSWQGVASSEQLTLSPAAGTLDDGGTGALTVTLQPGLLILPGKATVTFADARGALHHVAVEWGASLL
ncbi:RNA polymerase sigma factor [Actinomadura rubteroloni]|uniref:RNA polymerase sigma factor n=1 Tax=Actinomadura rubteroloni TaxID=1926885 RepID=UPI001F3CA390|nr:RNA polymerase sigma factor [Actinomadura rubteroloni]